MASFDRSRYPMWIGNEGVEAHGYCGYAGKVELE